jgi:antitoxin VapB
MAKRKRPAKRAREKEQRAKLFWTGRSQAVRLPKEFRIDADSVVIRRSGKLIILQPDDDWHDFLEWAKAHPLSDAFEIPPRSKDHRKLPDLP